MTFQHINITMPDNLKEALDKEAAKENIGRSTLIQKAILCYFEIRRRKSLNQELREAYSQMAGEAKLLSREFKHLDDESLKYVD